LKIKHGGKITNYLTKFYTKYASTISLNKDLLISGLVGFIVSLIAAYISTRYSYNDFTISTLTVIAGFISSKVIFVVLFHLDNKKKYTKRFTGKLNFEILKQIATKMIFANAVFDVINNVLRFFILLELLKIQYQPIQAATIASIIASGFSYVAINLIVRRIHVFRTRKKLF
jgi:ABC-type uncharacterized transport system permease subunit